MPQARKSTRSTSRGTSSFKEPAALKRLNKSLGDAQKAITELRTHAGRTAASSTQGLYKGLGKFVKDAQRDTGKFASALKSDFDKAQKTASRTTAARKAAGSRTSARSSGTTTTSRARTTRRAATKSTARKTS